MKIQYLGTGAAERVPAIFCKCEVCEYARQHKGKDIRTQTQALVDDGGILIDFPGDTYLHELKYEINFNDIRHLLLTHWHSDHLYAEDLAYRMTGYANDLDHPLDVYVNAYTYTFCQRAFELEGRTDETRFNFHIVKPYRAFTIGGYTIYPLPAQHGHFEEDCFIYAIQGPDGKCALWSHDSGPLTDAMYAYLVAQHLQFDMLSLDCTGQTAELHTKPHMSWYDDLATIKKLKELGLMRDSCRVVVNHFSHNGGLNYAQMKALADPEHIVTSYDGMTVEF